MPLVRQCEETAERFKLNKKLFDSGKSVELSYPSFQPHCCMAFPSQLPMNVKRLKQLQSTGDYSDINIYIEGHGLVAQLHKVILSLWSVPFSRVSHLHLASVVSPCPLYSMFWKCLWKCISW